jgi:hypothetical protein
LPEFEWGDFGFNFDVVAPKAQENTSEEIDIDDFDDEKFNHECPKCGFRF